MSPEEFERIKEQEKAHLRELQRLKGLAREAGRQGRLSQALRDIAGAGQSGDYDEMMDRLTRDTAMSEARLEIALENRKEADDSFERQAEQARAEAELGKERARQAVEEMKRQMGTPAAADRGQPSPEPSGEKSLGRTGDAPRSSEAPGTQEKTLGRRS